MMTKPIFALVFALSACTGTSKDTAVDTPVDTGESQDTSQDSGGGEDTAQDSGETGDAFELSEGVWTGTYSLLENECGAEPNSADMELTVSNIDGNSFTLASDPLVYTCAIESLSATCDPIVIEENVGETLSVTGTANMGFTLESETSMSGLAFIEYSCVGEGCEEFIGHPEGVFCIVDVPWEATLSE